MAMHDTFFLHEKLFMCAFFLLKQLYEGEFEVIKSQISR